MAFHPLTMKILDPHSLIATIDHFNEAHFRGQSWQAEAPAVAEWISRRLGQKGGYGGSFAMTESDWDADFRLFTGERLHTRAGRSHVIAEEAARVLRLIEADSGETIDALHEAEQRLGERIFGDPRGIAREQGEYCCGPCSVALWRNLLAGGFPGEADCCARGFARLADFRKEDGGWSRFPFYYTLLTLSEGGPFPEATRELTFHRSALLRRHRLLASRNDRYSRRRAEILRRTLSAIS